MAIQSSFYLVDGSTRTFPSTKHIATKQHCAIYLKSATLLTWSVISSEYYSLINNSIVFDTAPLSALYSDIEIRVADTQGELTSSPSDISIVAGDTIAINTVSTNIDSVNTNATNINSINTTSGSIANINTNATNIVNLNAIATTIVPNITEILLADDNATIATAQAVIATNAANSAINTLATFQGIFLGTLTSHPLVADVGDFYFNSATNVLYFKGTSAWIPSINPTSSTTTETLVTVTTTAETISVPYTVGLVEVYLNGVRLVNGNDFTATDGLTIVALVGATYNWTTGDNMLIVSYDVDTRNLYTAPEVDALLAFKSNSLSPTFTGTVVLPSTTSIGTVTNTEIGYLSGTTSSIQSQLGTKAPLASPALTGVPTAPTATAGDKSTKLATTAYANSLLAEYTVTGSAVTSIDFTGLDINTHKSYRIEFEYYNATASAVIIYMYINGDTTNTHYYNQHTDSSATAVSSANNNDSRTGGIDASTEGYTTVNIVLGNTMPQWHRTTKNGRSALMSIGTGVGNMSATYPQSNITQLTFTSSVASALDIGSKIRIYRGDV